MAVIALEGMEFFGRHGVFASEQENGNTFVVDVRLFTGEPNEAPLPETDRLEDALDYGLVYAVVCEAMEERANLLETLVMRIGKGLAGRVPGWKQATVKVSKLNPPLSGRAVCSYVEENFIQAS